MSQHVKKLKVSWRTGQHCLPEGVQKLAANRVRDMIDFYGHFIRTISLEQLAESCYLQGVEDAMLAAVAEATKLVPPSEMAAFDPEI